MPKEFFEQRERKLLGERYETLYSAPSKTAARGVTVNLLRCTPEWFAAHAGLAVSPSPFCSAGLLIEDPAVKLGRHPYHHAGAFYSQEPSASAPAAMLDVQPGMKVLDLCAAPGGKSSQLAAALGGKGLLVSNEYDGGRAVILRQNLERMGVANAVVLNETPARIAATLPGFFDRILVDAPCSGEGMFRKEPQALAQHGPVGAFLARHPEFELLPWPDGFGSPGETNRCGEHPFAAEKTRRIWPCQGGEGHFMAKLRKVAPAETRKTARVKTAKAAKPNAAWQAFAGEYFPQLAGLPAMQLEDMVLLMPEGMPALKLHVLRAGVLAGTVQKNRFVPAHHLFTAFGAGCTNREELTLEDDRTQAWLRGEEIEAHTAQNGWCCVTVDGMPLSGGKVSGGKVKNHLPKALRNLG